MRIILPTTLTPLRALSLSSLLHPWVIPFLSPGCPHTAVDGRVGDVQTDGKQGWDGGYTREEGEYTMVGRLYTHHSTPCGIPGYHHPGYTSLPTTGVHLSTHHGVHLSTHPGVHLSTHPGRLVCASLSLPSMVLGG